MFVIENLCQVYNYADDTTISCTGRTIDDVYARLNNVMDVMLAWFQNNYLQANPSKFQLIVFIQHKQLGSIELVNDIELEPKEHVNLLGVQVDEHLSFNGHIANICPSTYLQVLNTAAKLLLFQTFILCHFNFCPVVWHFCNVTNMTKIEKVGPQTCI